MKLSFQRSATDKNIFLNIGDRLSLLSHLTTCALIQVHYNTALKRSIDKLYVQLCYQYQDKGNKNTYLPTFSRMESLCFVQIFYFDYFVSLNKLGLDKRCQFYGQKLHQNLIYNFDNAKLKVVVTKICGKSLILELSSLCAHNLLFLLFGPD